jgi:hypothetical protein
MQVVRLKQFEVTLLSAEPASTGQLEKAFRQANVAEALASMAIYDEMPDAPAVGQLNWYREASDALLERLQTARAQSEPES